MSDIESVEADCLALTAHTKSIEVPHRAAFSGPVVRDYQPGDIVWLFDHYNTGIVERTSSLRADWWIVTTTSVEGNAERLEYKSAWLRPATEARVFTWTRS